jgi:ribosomal-protein-alanine N-acetyltransferase
MTIIWLNAAQALERADELMALAGELKDAPQWSRAQWEALVESMREGGGTSLRRDVVVVEANESKALLGFLVVATVAGEAEIESIAVRSEFQGRGVGRRLLAAMVEFLILQGIARVQLEVRESNERAIGFYRALGFEVEGQRAGYYQDPTEDALLLSRSV